MESKERKNGIPGFKKTLDKMLTICEAKSADYSGDKNPFHNFKMVEELGISTTEKGILTRMTDKLARATTLVDNKASVKDESIEDTLIDLANYAVILKCYIENKKRSIIAEVPRVPRSIGPLVLRGELDNER